MSKIDDSNRHRVLDVMDTVLEIGFDGCTMEDIARHLGIMYHSVRRALIPLEASEWVVEYRREGSNQKLWKPGKKLVGICFAYKRHCVKQKQKIEAEYIEVTGEVLSNG